MTRRILRSGFALVAPLLVLIAAGCGGSKETAPSPATPSATPSPGPTPAPTPTPPPPAVRVSFRTINVLTGRPVTGVRVQIDGRADLDSGPTGAFVVEGGAANVLAVTLSSSEIVTRVTHLRVPGSDGEIGLIPKDFNMSAFEQMTRRSGFGLVRWTTPPRLVIQRRVLRWSEAATDTYTSTDQLMSDASAKAIIDDLVMALPDLTGSEFRSFADIVHTTAGVNNPVSMVSAGDIIVAYFTGLTAARGAIGVGSRTYGNDGSVRSGQVYLDAGYDGQGLYAHIARMHELGHALGWDHVTDAASVMTPVATNWPTSFDRDATKIAFKRGLGNRAPDSDQDAFTINPLGLAGFSIKLP